MLGERKPDRLALADKIGAEPVVDQRPEEVILAP